MKKFTLSILAVLIAAFVMTSCIDNAVSPEVKAIRASQVNLLNAQTALQNANAAYRTAEASLKSAEAALKNAEAQAKLEDAEKQDIANQEALIVLELNVAKLETNLAKEELLLQQAIDNLAKYIADYDLKLASGYLKRYAGAMDTVKLTADKISAENRVIAGLELYYKAAIVGNPNSGAYYESIREFLTRELEEAELTLSNAEAALEIILTIEADPAAAAAQKAQLIADIQDLKNDSLAQAVVIAPLNTAKTDADGADNTASDALAKQDAALAAIATIESFKAKNDTKVTDATTAAATALTAANTKFATKIAQLKPYLDALEATYASNTVFGDSTINIEQATRVATNALKVARAQENVAVGSATAALAKANTSVTNVITRIKTISGRTNVQMPYIVTDETTYPGYVASVAGTYVLSVTALTAAMVPAVNDTYTMGGVTYTIMATAPAIGDVFIRVSGKGDPAITGGTLTKVTGAATANITVGAGSYTTVSGTYTDGTTSTAGATLLFAINKQNGRIEQDEVDALATQLITVDLAPANATTATTLSTNYGLSASVYDAIKGFFAVAGPGPAQQLVIDIGKYAAGTFLTDFAATTPVKGVVASMTINGLGADWTGASGVTVKNAAVTTAQNYYTNGIKVGNKDKDGVGPDPYVGATFTLSTATLAPTVAAVGDDEKLALAYQQLAAYSTSDTYTQGGETDAAAMKVAVTAAQVAATATLAPLKAATTAATTAYNDAVKVNDATTGFGKKIADKQAILGAVEGLLSGTSGINLEVTKAKDAIETAVKDVDSAEFNLLLIDDDLAKIDAEIAAKQARVDGWEVELAAWQAAAASWLELVNDALGN